VNIGEKNFYRKARKPACRQAGKTQRTQSLDYVISLRPLRLFLATFAVIGFPLLGQPL